MGKSQIKVRDNLNNTNKKKMQNLAIKKRLADYYLSIDEHVRPSIYSLQMSLSQMQDGFTVSYNTLNEMLSESRTDTTPNLHLVLALCRYWHLDYATILAPAEITKKPVPAENALIAKTEVLDDDGYSGNFYGYMYTKNVKRIEIVEFELLIDPSGDSTIATLTVYNNTDKVDGDTLDYKTVYVGTPLLLSKKNIVAMTLVDDTGAFYSFYLDYRHYNIDKLYYRKGIAVTTESESDKPLLNNFVLFQKKVSEEKRKTLIPGLLPLIGDSFVITKDDMESFMKNEDMVFFFNDYAYNWQGKEKEMYRIRVSHVLKSIEDENNEFERYRVINALLKLIEKSQAPVRIEYSNPEGMPGFAKTVIQRG